jgi:2-polyprenyl-3-methyl-5-hydroxy-6-metoxy-1,4-benzoquinol methylase
MQDFETALSLSPIKSVAAVAPLDDAAARMREEIASDLAPEVQRRVSDPSNQRWLTGYWYQRIRLPLGFTTKSDHGRVIDRGANPLHNLYGRLTPHEGAIVQPWTKWDYLSKILPDFANKSILDIGSANGFFSLQFAARGASVVNGIEAVKDQVDRATAVAELCGVANVHFFQGDAFYDSIEPHDVVFLSEVANHSVIPYHALFRVLGLAKETVIFDEYTAWDVHALDYLHLQPYTNGAAHWASTCLSERTILTICYLAGVELSQAVRWRDDRASDWKGRRHTTFVIDTRGASERRLGRLHSPNSYLRSMVESAMGLRQPRRIGARAAA